MRSPTFGILALAAALAIGGVANAVAQSVELQISDGVVYAGVPFQATITVNGAKPAERPAFPTLPSCRAEDAGVQTTVINGRGTYSYTYRLEASHPGELTIPPIAVRVNGQTLYTPETTVTISAVGAIDPTGRLRAFVRLMGGDDRPVYVGQRVTLKLELWVRAADYRGRRVSAGDMTPARDYTYEGERTEEDASGEPVHYYVYSVTWRHTPDRPGRLTLPGLVVSYNYPILGVDRFFNRIVITNQDLIRIAPQTPDIVIRPLPTENQPAAFTGAVGVFDVAASAEPRDVRVGDPIELKIRIRGDGDLERVKLPDLAQNPAFADNFRLPDEPPPSEATDNAKLFNIVIRAATADVTEVPPIEFPYFDPFEGRYAVARTDAIPLNVQAVEHVDPSAIANLSTTQSSTSLQRLDGLRGNETSEPRLLARVALTDARGAWIAAAGPAVVFALLWTFVTFLHPRAADESRKRRAAAMSKAKRALADAGVQQRPDAGAVRAALINYVADRLDVPPASLVGAAVRDALLSRNVSPDNCDRFCSLLDRCEAAAFGGAGADEQLIRQARDCLAAVAKEGL